jgi:putative methionine-R-sulfoxide reductase with GAF domain
MTESKSIPTQVVRPLSGSIKSQITLILLGMMIFAVMGLSWLAIRTIEGLGNSTLEIGKMAAVDQAVTNELQEALDSNLRQFVFLGIIPLGIFLIGAAVAISTIWSNRVVKPIHQLVENTKNIRAEALPSIFPLEAPGEIGRLAAEQAALVEHLHLQREKQQEQTVTQADTLAKRTRQLLAAAHFAREATAIQQPEPLMERAVNLVGDRFGYYHVAIFLIDPSGQYAVLRAATGEAGKKMINMGQRLKIGQTSVVGYVASTGRVYTVHDVRMDPIFLRNPLLSETQSEVVLPLRVSQRTIGVLDIQSRQVEIFTEFDIQALQALADQISVTIDKLHWHQEYQETLARLQRVRGESQPGGRQLSQPVQRIDGFIYDLTGVKAIPVGGEPLTADARATGTPIHLPLKVRGEVVATLDLWSDKENLSTKEQDFLDDLGERLSQAIESAQLFEETQVRVRREQIYNRFSANLSRSLDLDALLQQAVRELGQMPDVNEVSIVMSQLVEPSEESTGESQ